MAQVHEVPPEANMPDSSDYVIRHRRPILVSIVSIIVMLFALFEIIVGIVALGGGTLNGFTGNFAFFGNLAAAGALLLVLGIITFIVALGLFRLRFWAWALVIILELIGLVTASYSYATKNYPPGTIVEIVIPLLIVIYLFAVRDAFS